MPTKYYVIDPNNVPSSQVFNYNNGNSNITFNIAQSSNEWLIPQSVKLVAKLTINDTNGVNQTDDKASLSVQCGLASVINMIEASSYETNQSISVLKNYSRVVSSLNSTCRGDYYDTLGTLSHSGVAYGQRFNDNNVGVYGANPSEETKQSYSMDVLLGVLQSKDKVYLANTKMGGVGGIKLNFLLNPTAQAVFTQDAANAPYTYSLSSVKLQYSTYESSNEEELQSARVKNDWSKSYIRFVRENESRQPSRDETEQQWQSVVANSVANKPSYNFREVVSYLSQVDNDDQNINLNLGKSAVSNIMVNFAPSTYLNSTTAGFDSNKTYMFYDNGTNSQPWTEITFTRGGVLDTPYTYTLTTNTDENFTATNHHTTSTRGEIVKGLLDSWLSNEDNKYTQISVENSLWNLQYFDMSVGDTIGGKGFGLSTGKVGLNGTLSYQNKPLTINVRSKGNGASVNNTGFIYATCETSITYNNGVMSVN